MEAEGLGEEEAAHLVLRQRAVVLEYLEELTLRELGDDADLVVSLEVVEHEHDVLVLQRAEDLDLLPQHLELLRTPAALRDELERDDLAAVLPPPLVHLAERTLAYLLQHVVVLHGHRSPRGAPTLHFPHQTVRAAAAARDSKRGTEVSEFRSSFHTVRTTRRGAHDTRRLLTRSQ